MRVSHDTTIFSTNISKVNLEDIRTMLRLFIKLFIQDADHVEKQEVRQAYGTLCGFLGIGLNLLLFIGKFLAGVFSHSIAIMADAFNNLSDAGSSFITLVGFRLSGSKPDPEHPFGHGRVEYLSGLGVSVMIILMAVELLKSSVEKIFHPEEVESNLFITGILVLSILVKLYMCSYNKAVGKKISSAAMQATAIDSLSDSVATTVVLFSTWISKFTGLYVDGYCGVLVGIFILFAGIDAAKDTINPLLGQAPDPKFVAEIKKIVAEHEEIKGIHDMVIHDYGPGRVMISLHAEVLASGDICVLHEAIDSVENELMEKLGCHAVIHMDPIHTDDPETLQLKKQIIEIIQKLDSSITMHDFRLVKKSACIRVIFDVVVPYHFYLSDKEVQETLQKEIQQIDGKYHAVIHVDKEFVG